MKLSLIVILAAAMCTTTSLAASLGATSTLGKDAYKRAFTCPTLPVNVNCLVSPCRDNLCGDDFYCCDDYRTGCNFLCIRNQ